jgi:hypothetical protein
MSGPRSPEQYGEGMDDEELEAAGWAAGLDVWGQVCKAYAQYVGNSTLANSQLWSLRQAIRAELLAEQDNDAGPGSTSPEPGPSPGWPDEHMLEAAMGLLANAVAFDPATGWDEAKRRWMDAYHRQLAVSCASPEPGPPPATFAAGPISELATEVHGLLGGMARRARERREPGPAWPPSENCYCGGPEAAAGPPHRLGTGYYCRRKPGPEAVK